MIGRRYALASLLIGTVCILIIPISTFGQSSVLKFEESAIGFAVNYSGVEDYQPAFGGFLVGSLGGTLDGAVGVIPTKAGTFLGVEADLHFTRGLFPKAPVLVGSVAYATELSGGTGRSVSDEAVYGLALYQQWTSGRTAIAPYFSVSSVPGGGPGKAMVGTGLSLGVKDRRRNQKLILSAGIAQNGQVTAAGITVGTIAYSPVRTN